MRSLAMLMIPLISSTAVAALEPIPGEERFADLKEDDSKRLGADVGVGQIGEDWFVTITPRFDLNLGKVGLGLQVPLNLRIKDDDPKHEPPEFKEDYGGYIRREDWDEPAEFLRAIRYIRYGHRHDLVYVRVGEIAAQIGHGTIMGRYMNNLNLDTFHLGLQFNVNTAYGGIETVASDLRNLAKSTDDSDILGVRGYFKPVSLVDPDSIANIFQLGATVISDLTAPWEYKVSDKLDDEGNPILDLKTQAMTVFGFDFGIELLRTSMLDLTPYTDLNFLDGGGWGWHVGIDALAKLPIGLDLQLPVRFEYRRFRNDYTPVYFSTFYDIERYAFNPGELPRRKEFLAGNPKSFIFKKMNAKDGYNGYYGDLAFDFAGIVQIGGLYEWYDVRDPTFALFLSVPALETIQFKAYYQRFGVKSLDDAFVLRDERSIAVAQARYQLVQFLYLVGRVTRRWQLDTDKKPPEPKAVDDWKFGFELAFDF